VTVLAQGGGEGREPRWLVRRRAEAAVASVRAEAIPVEDACHRYRLTLAQFAACERAAERFRASLRRFA